VEAPSSNSIHALCGKVREGCFHAYILRCRSMYGSVDADGPAAAVESNKVRQIQSPRV
jgi:hypothetical protein